MSEIEALIAKLEAAGGPSRKLDAEIWVLIGLTEAEERHCRDWCRMDGRTDLTRERFISAWAKHYTESLDAALTLVPEGWEWKLSNRAAAPHTGRAYLHNRELINSSVGGLGRNPAYRGVEVTAATPAIATVIAAIKARLATERTP